MSDSEKSNILSIYFKNKDLTSIAEFNCLDSNPHVSIFLPDPSMI